MAKAMTMGELRTAQGVSDSRWTCDDKLLMYKGILKVYNKERQNQIKDTDILITRNDKKIKKLLGEIETLKETLFSWMYFDKQKLRNSLQNDRNIQICYQHSAPEHIIEELKHKNFCRSKALDNIKNRKDRCADELFKAQVEMGDTEIVVQNTVGIRLDLRQQYLTNHILNFNMKMGAARAIQQVYEKMKNILFNDQRYYEIILVTLQRDADSQATCLIRATEMGQLATEECTNLKAEYRILEKQIKTHMREREKMLKDIKERIAEVRDEYMGFVRTESDVDLQVKAEQMEKGKKGRTMEDDIKDLEDIINELMEVTNTNTVDEILPRMVEQIRQKKRLTEQLEYNSSKCNEYLDKKNHSELMFYELHLSGEERHKEYKDNKETLEQNIEEQNEKIKNSEEESDKLANQISDIRYSIKRLCQAVREIKIPPFYEDQPVPEPEVLEDGTIIEPNIPPVDEDARRLLNFLQAKMKYIRIMLREKNIKEEQIRAFTAKFEYTTNIVSKKMFPPKEEEKESELILDVDIEDFNVPSHNTIKEQSAEIYALATRNPFEVEEPKKKK